MKLKYIKAPSIRGELIATTNNKGNLYLNVAIVNYLELNKNKFIQFGSDMETKDKNVFYGIIHDVKNPYSFRFYRQGLASMTVHINSVLSEIGLPFKTENMKFTVSIFEEHEVKYVKFERILK